MPQLPDQWSKTLNRHWESMISDQMVICEKDLMGLSNVRSVRLGTHIRLHLLLLGDRLATRQLGQLRLDP